MSPVRWVWEGLDVFVPRPLVESAPPVVWRVSLDDCPAGALRDASETLSLEERQRMVAFRFETDRRRFAASRLALRHVVAGYVHARPEHLAFRRLAHGKPVLDGPYGPLSFSLSHTGGTLFVALHPARVVGVDVEPAAPEFPLEDILSRVLTPWEIERLQQTPPSGRPAAFIRYWTVKEAVLKASGDGLSQSMLGLDVDFSAPAPRLRRVPSSYPDPELWRLDEWRGGGLRAALAWVDDYPNDGAGPPR